jgi:hypothetical protein
LISRLLKIFIKPVPGIFMNLNLLGMNFNARHFPRQLLFLLLMIGLTGNVSISKTESLNKFQQQKKESFQYTTEVLDKWMRMQIHLMTHTQASFNGPFIRIYAYSGIAAYASINPAAKDNSSTWFLISRLNNMPALPKPDPGKKLYGPASLNAALAFMNRIMFPMASDGNKAAIDSLEAALKISFYSEVEPLAITYSTEYGRQLARIIFHWAETDGYKNGNDSYTPPAGQGKWKPTAPSYAKAVSPYWGLLRTIVPGSNEHTEPLPPPDYSEDTAAVFYKMVKQVYDISKTVTPEQKNIAFFWKDINPGVTAPGHWLNILRQVIQKENTSLEKAAFAYALSGIALNDTWISSWKTRYAYNVLRPISYIQTVMGYTDWTPVIPTPPHPEYPGGHAALSSSVAEVLTELFGDNYHFTDHTYDHLNLAPRSYSSFREIAEEAAISKVYGGIHYRLSVEVGLQQGKDVTQNILFILLNKGSRVNPKNTANQTFSQ